MTDVPTGTGYGIATTFNGKQNLGVLVMPESLLRMWGIGIETAKRTLLVTTQQQGLLTAIYPLQCRVDHLHLDRRRLNGDWYSDTLFSKVILLQGNGCAQVFTNGRSKSVHPLNLKAKVGQQALTEFSDDIGFPDFLTTYGAPEIVGPGMEFMREIN